MTIGIAWYTKIKSPNSTVPSSHYLSVPISYDDMNTCPLNVLEEKADSGVDAVERVPDEVQVEVV